MQIITSTNKKNRDTNQFRRHVAQKTRNKENENKWRIDSKIGRVGADEESKDWSNGSNRVKHDSDEDSDINSRSTIEH